MPKLVHSRTGGTRPRSIVSASGPATFEVHNLDDELLLSGHSESRWGFPVLVFDELTDAGHREKSYEGNLRDAMCEGSAGPDRWAGFLGTLLRPVWRNGGECEAPYRIELSPRMLERFGTEPGEPQEDLPRAVRRLRSAILESAAEAGIPEADLQLRDVNPDDFHRGDQIYNSHRRSLGEGRSIWVQHDAGESLAALVAALRGRGYRCRYAGSEWLDGDWSRAMESRLTIAMDPCSLPSVLSEFLEDQLEPREHGPVRPPQLRMNGGCFSDLLPMGRDDDPHYGIALLLDQVDSWLRSGGLEHRRREALALLVEWGFDLCETRDEFDRSINFRHTTHFMPWETTKRS